MTGILITAAVIAVIVLVLVLDWRASNRLKARLNNGADAPGQRYDPTTHESTNYDILRQQSNQTRNGTSGFSNI